MSLLRGLFWYCERKKASLSSAFVEGFGVDGEAIDLREFLLDAIFDGGCDIVNLRNGQIAVHGAMARDENFVFNEADMNVVAVRELVKFGGERIDEIADARGKPFHFLAANNLGAERLDVDVHSGFAADGAKEIVFEFGGETMCVAKARALVHFEMKFDEQPAVDLMRG